MLSLAAGCTTEMGRYDESESMLAHAKVLARRSGMVRVFEEACEHEARLAAKRRKGRSKGSEVSLASMLTDREWQVACIGGAGRTTREIARELNLSPRTVDVHLTNIYRKLEVQSHAGLVKLMAEYSSTASDAAPWP